MDGQNPSDKAESVRDFEELIKNIIKVDQGVTETDDSDSSEKENQNKPKIPHLRNATRKQIRKLNAFMHEHDKSSITRKKFDDMWSILTAELNSIGPPSFTDVQWKAKWSQHKYNKKRKRENDDEYEEVPVKSCQDQPPRSIHALDPITQHTSSTISVLPDATSVSNKLDIIIEQNTSIISKLDSLLNLNVRKA